MISSIQFSFVCGLLPTRENSAAGYSHPSISPPFSKPLRSFARQLWLNVDPNIVICAVGGWRGVVVVEGNRFTYTIDPQVSRSFIQYIEKPFSRFSKAFLFPLQRVWKVVSQIVNSGRHGRLLSLVKISEGGFPCAEKKFPEPEKKFPKSERTVEALV